MGFARNVYTTIASWVRWLDDTTDLHWRWVLFGSQLVISLMTLFFSFHMIRAYGTLGSTQKVYWPIVTIIIGYFMPNAGSWYEFAKKAAAQRAQRKARGDLPRGLSPRRKKSKAGHRMFYVAQVLVALAVMGFCMNQLVTSQEEKLACENRFKIGQTTSVLGALAQLQQVGALNATAVAEATSSIVNAAAAPAAIPSPSPVPAGLGLALLSSFPLGYTGPTANMTAVGPGNMTYITCNVAPTSFDAAANITNPGAAASCNNTMEAGTYTLMQDPPPGTEFNRFDCYDVTSGSLGAPLAASPSTVELLGTASVTCVASYSLAGSIPAGSVPSTAAEAAPSAAAESAASSAAPGNATGSTEGSAASSNRARRLLQAESGSKGPSQSYSSGAADDKFAQQCFDRTKELEGIYLPILTAINGFFMPKEPDKLEDDDDEQQDKKKDEGDAALKADQEGKQSQGQAGPSAVADAAPHQGQDQSGALKT